MPQIQSTSNEYEHSILISIQIGACAFETCISIVLCVSPLVVPGTEELRQGMSPVPGRSSPMTSYNLTMLGWSKSFMTLISWMTSASATSGAPEGGPLYRLRDLGISFRAYSSWSCVLSPSLTLPKLPFPRVLTSAYSFTNTMPYRAPMSYLHICSLGFIPSLNCSRAVANVMFPVIGLPVRHLMSRHHWQQICALSRTDPHIAQIKPRFEYG